jgi:hypothetical protein
MGNHPGGDAGEAFGKTYWTLSHNIYSTDTIPCLSEQSACCGRFFNEYIITGDWLLANSLLARALHLGVGKPETQEVQPERNIFNYFRDKIS